MARAIIIPTENENKAPAAPSWLSTDAKAEWRRLWKTGVSTLWQPEQHDLVARLADMRVDFRTSPNVDTATRMNVQIAKLESMLFLALDAQHRAGIEVEVKRASSPAEGKREAIEQRLRLVK